MHAWVRRALCAVGITGGIVLLGMGLAEAASADGNSGPVTSGQNGILSGNQTGIDAQAPINLSGNQITVIGQDNHAGSTGGATTASSGGGASSGSPTTSGQSGIGSGNQTAVGVQAPVNASGNQVTVIGQHNTVQSLTASSTGGGGGGSAAPTTTGQGGLIAGNQTAVGLALPINLSGNQVTVIGQDNTLGSLGGALAGGGTGGTTSGSSGGPTTSGQNGIVSGNQTGIGIGIPINASGNQVTVIGQDNTVSALGGSTTGGGSGGSTGGPTTSGQDGIGSGNQTGLTLLAPIAAPGNQVTVIGQDNTVTSTGGSSTGGGTTGTGETTTGQGGVGSGNQTPIVVQVPVDTSGNQVTVVGQGNTVTSTGGSTTGGGTTGGTTPVTNPPGGVVVSPPTTGGGGTANQGSGQPGATALPSTGAGADLLALALLGMLLLSAGLVLSRPRRLTVR